MATQLPFSVQKQNIVLVKPSKPTPHETLFFSTIDNDLNLEVHCHAIYAYEPNPNTQIDPFRLFQDALSSVLVFYYPLAGKLKRHADKRLRLNCNSNGVPFVAAIADCTLSSLNYLDSVEPNFADHFTFDYDISADQSEDGYHPLVLQVTKFSCGGFTVAMGITHAVCDGVGAGQFFRALTEMAAGKSEPSVKPVWERERLTWKNPLKQENDDEHRTADHDNAKSDKEVVAKSPYLPSDDLVHQYFYIDGESLKNLKLRLMKEFEELEGEAPKQILTTVEALGAYVWRARARALRLDPAGKTYVCFPVGLRLRRNPPLPHGYYGNGFVLAKTGLTVKELDEGSLARAIKLIRQSKRIDCSDDFLNKYLGELEKAREAGEKIDATGAYTVLTNWRQLGLQEEADFGWGGSVNVRTLPCPFYGYVDLCMLLPPCKVDRAMDGGVAMLVSLPRDTVPKFKDEIDALKKAMLN